MTLVLDAGAVSALVRDRGKLRGLVRLELWPALVPAAVLVEALTGDHRRDHDANRLLKTCDVREVDEIAAREAARLRTATGRAGSISAVDAIVVAFAARLPDALVLTGDLKDLRALAAYATAPVKIARV